MDTESILMVARWEDGVGGWPEGVADALWRLGNGKIRTTVIA